MTGLHGSTIPDDHGGYVVTVICPNEYSLRRLQQAIDNINPSAAMPLPLPVIPLPTGSADVPGPRA